MTIVAPVSHEASPRVIPGARNRGHTLFYRTMTIVSVLVVLIGFGPTYYFKPILPYVILVLIGPIYDRLTTGHIHRAYLWGAPLIIVSVPVRIALGGTGIWHSVFDALVR